MFTNRFEDLWNTAAGDGASCPVGPCAPHPEVELEQIMEAWSLERGRSIEASLLLDRSRKLLERVLAEGAISVKHQHAARRLIRAIVHSGKE